MIMSYKKYRFCQSPIVSIVLALIGVQSLYGNVLGLNTWLSAILGVITVLALIFIPLISLISPFIFTICFLVCIISELCGSCIVPYLAYLIIALVLYLYRYIAMLKLNSKHPKIGAMYDQWIREGLKELPPDVNNEVLKELDK